MPCFGEVTYVAPKKGKQKPRPSQNLITLLKRAK